MTLADLRIDHTWTVFLDRDGVINRRIVDGYVRNWGEWEWLSGAKEAIVELSGIVKRIAVVTNQRGIACGLMTEADLAEIHRRMLAEVEAAGGKLDGVYHCPHGRDDGCVCRKPRPGLVYQARRDFPDIDMKRSIVVGDSRSDMELAFPLGLYGAFVGDAPPDIAGKAAGIVPSLAAFVAAIR